MANNVALAEVSDIEGYFTGLKFASDTRPSRSQVVDWINTASALVYSALNDKYILPITNTVDLLQLKTLATTYVLAEVNFVLGKASTNVISQSGAQRQIVGISHKDFYDLLDAYTNEDIVLLNTPLRESWTMGQSYNAEALKSSGNTTAFVSSKDESQW